MIPQIVGVVLVKNEDIYVGQAIRNVAGFCDRIHVVDNGSIDNTWEILRAAAREFDHVDLRRLRNIRRSHALVERYVDTPTWVFGVDGDELYDPAGLVQLRSELREGAYRDQWRVKSNVLNAVAVDPVARTASGYLAPPSRPMTKLFNFAGVSRWRGPSQQILHGGDRVFHAGFDHDVYANVGDHLTWAESHFRCLHCCFVRRSSRDTQAPEVRLNPLDAHRARASRLAPWRGRRSAEMMTGPEWRLEKYRRGPVVTVDAAPFLDPISIGEE